MDLDMTPVQVLITVFIILSNTMRLKEILIKCVFLISPNYLSFERTVSSSA